MCHLEPRTEVISGFGASVCPPQHRPEFEQHVSVLEPARRGLQHANRLAKEIDPILSVLDCPGGALLQSRAFGLKQYGLHGG